MNVTNSNLEVHLHTLSPVTRDDTKQAFPVNENDQPARKTEGHLAMVQSIHEIIDWLDVEDSNRYQKKGGSTYCNIYAYDFSYLCGTYIPRVWWDDESIRKVMSGIKLKPRYGTNIFNGMVRPTS